MLAPEPITVCVGPKLSLELRPTLRAAIVLERSHGGFDAILKGIADMNVTVMLDVIGRTATGQARLSELLDELEGQRLGFSIVELQPALIRLVYMLGGIDVDAEAQAEEPSPTGRVSFGKHLADLFKIGTGWLGWTVADTYDAAPAEIMAAYSGRLDMLKAIFGSSEDDASDSRPSVYDDTRDESGAAMLKAMAGQRIGDRLS